MQGDDVLSIDLHLSVVYKGNVGPPVVETAEDVGGIQNGGAVGVTVHLL